MGKSQKKRSARRHNPVRVPDSHLPSGLAAATSTSSKTEAVLPIIEKLESADAEDRVWACAAVCTLIQNDPSTRRLLQGKNIVGVLITRLSDSVEEVVSEAAGALRNLCIDGGYDICAEMYNKNIVAPLKTFIPKISITLTQFLASPSTAPENAKKLVFEFAENVITIIWCLSETSNKALQAVNNASITSFLMSFLLHRENLPKATVTAAAQCLYVLTDDNSPAIDDVRSSPEYITCLMEIAQSSEPSETNGHAMEVDQKTLEEERSLGLRVLACGILRNITPLPPMIPAAAIDIERTIIVPFLVPLLSIPLEDLATRAHTLASQPVYTLPRAPGLNQTPKSDHKSAAEQELERIEMRLRTIQLALEILTTVCARLPDPTEPEKGSDSEMDDAVNPGDDDDDIKDDLKEETLPAGTEASLLSALTPPLLVLARPTLLSFPPPSMPSIHPPTTSALGAVHVAAFECLNNLFLGIEQATVANDASSEAVGVWGQIWSVLYEVGRPSEAPERGQERRKEVWEVAAGVLWGLARVSKGHLVPQEEQVKILIELCDTTKDDKTKVKCIGTLGCLAQCLSTIDANKVISTYLLNLLTSTQPEPLIQAVSELIDIFSDEESPYDVNFREGRWVETLAAAQPGVRRVVKGIDRRKEGGRELRRWADEMVMNLSAFIDYRRALKL
ncbi:hypothetical protein BOTBODRAFT_108287 [Botryobasidium botryosum FD-172 SS1]|uniref:SYO1-like TPR repeats domain-containing protein n=1 Tax=Botryobasidium botryosum (strain FD-172 SS1) TaxID=930990 RepID=A0A067MJD7_BOTB1|nr:hypothetical protein BOTBODRAFT_108287 [Botryobasidium botryosum FD-172 SS1]